MAPTATPARGRVRVETSPKWVRAVIDGVTVADTTRPLLVWEQPYYPTYYLPRADVIDGVLVPNGGTERSPSRGDATVFDLRVGDRVVAGGAYAHPDSPIEELRDHVVLRWDAVDHWFEEDEEVFVHARDPYTRVDVLPSSRRVRIEVAGRVVAESGRPTLLFETGLPTRYYLPASDVRWEHLTPTDTTSDCPYKGTARWWAVADGDGTVHPELAWSYPTTTRESGPIAGLVAFYDERVDVYVDGELQERPRTKFS